MTEKQNINLKNTVKVAKKHVVGMIFSNIIGYIIRSLIYAGVIFGGIWYAVKYHAYPDWSWLAGTAFYIFILVVTFFLRIRSIYSSITGAALDAAEEVISSSDHKAAKAGTKGFRILRWFVG